MKIFIITIRYFINTSYIKSIVANIITAFVFNGLLRLKIIIHQHFFASRI